MFTRTNMILAAVSLLALPTTVRAEQRVGFSLGYFSVLGADSRADGDVLIANRQSALPLAFLIDDFNSVTVGGEWLAGIGRYVEVGAGIGYYGRTVHSVYEDFVDSDGSEIEQDLKLRIVPFTITARLLPFGSDGPFQPYVGGGLGIFSWRYSEIGEFVSPSDLTIFNERFIANGTDVGPVVLGGVRVPVGDPITIGGEIRYQRARGSLDGDEFLGDTIDLGGYTYQAVFHLRF
jgi:opacity protein-like surface antigen